MSEFCLFSDFKDSEPRKFIILKLELCQALLGEVSGGKSFREECARNQASSKFD